MKVRKISRALICDEFGDFVGMVTLKDIFEGLVGSMDNEEDEPEIINRADNGGWLVDGQCSLYDLLCYFDCGDLYEASGYHTLAGLILDRLQRITRSGEKLEWNSFVFEIMDNSLLCFSFNFYRNNASVLATFVGTFLESYYTVY